MCHVDNKKRENETMEGTEVPTQNALREGKLQVLGNIGSRPQQTNRDVRNSLKGLLHKIKKKTSRNPTQQQKSLQRN